MENNPKPITVAWGNRDGEDVLLDIYLPEQPTGAVYVFFFGGGWIAGNKETFECFGTLRRALLNAGVTIVAPNYRLCGNGRKFPVPADDCADALRWLAVHGGEYGLDPTRVAVGGISAGGHLSLMMGLAGEQFGDRSQPFPTIRCIADMCGPSDLRANRNVPEKETISECYAALFGSEESGWEAQYDAASPITYLRAKPDDTPLPPLMAVHSQLDKLVFHSQSELMVAEYQRRGMEATLLTMENSSHAFGGIEGMPPPKPTFFQMQERMASFIIAHI